MPGVNDIFRRHAPDYLKKYGAKMLPSHKRAIEDIVNCRTEKSGSHTDVCDKCGHVMLFYHSCSNRSCPQCYASRTQKWLEKKKNILLPVPYFHVVFTLPQELRSIVRSNQKPLFNCLFQAATYALTKLLAEPEFAGGIGGMLAVLHTWTRTKEYHPHVHYLIPAGVISKDGAQWKPIKRKKFLVPLKSLSSIFRARFIKLSRKALPGVDFPEALWHKRWVVFSKPLLKGGRKVLQYLARYVHRIALSNNNISQVKDGKVTFKYSNASTGKKKKMTLPVHEFMRRFLMHVLPMGFHKVRSYGFLAPKYKGIFNALKARLEISEKNSAAESEDTRPPNHCRRCPKCESGIMVVVVHSFPTKKGELLVRPPP